MENNGLIAILCALFLLLGGFVGAVGFSDTTEIEVPIITEKLVMPNCSEAVLPDYSGDYVLTQSDLEARAEEAKAEELFLESIDSRDFKKSIFEALLLYGEPIDSYKDITSMRYEYDIDDDEIEVENLKVYYFIDGDDEENEKALFEDFKVEINELDFEDLDDAEIDEDYFDNLVVEKVYS